MKKLSITYRATIDRHVPIAVKSRAGKKVSARPRFVFFRDRSRVSA